MKLVVNGQDERLKTDLEQVNIISLLEIKDVEMPDMVSVELNGTILNRSDFSSTIVKEGDRVEFLYFMGGGA
ncbi:MAG: sulfur carrier protein ThiS [bacterium]|nr:sulfur carrier protein ThiS [bacterium]